MAHKVKYRKFS